ncbi:hypothetical protein, partial [Enterobacter intestinihominis]
MVFFFWFFFFYFILVIFDEYFRVFCWGFYFEVILINALGGGGAFLGAINGGTGGGGAGAKPAGSNPLEILAEGASGNNAVP